jgi:tetratricopeptide (TPR) repeat protein
MEQSAAELNRVGVSYAQKRDFRQAAECFRRAIALNSNSADYFVNLANVLAELGDFQAAKASYLRALKLEPSSIDLHLNLALLLTLCEDFPGAAASYQRAAQLDPNRASTQVNLGIALTQVERLSEAILAFQTATRLAPRDAEAHQNLALALVQSGDVDAGRKSLQQALQLRPNFPEAHCAFACALMDHGLLSESLAHFDAALKLKPDYQAAIRLRAVTLLLAGDYARGWREYDQRIKESLIVQAAHQSPLWDGSPLAGRTLLLEAEQGFGDTIQFVRYTQEIKRTHDCRVIVAVQPPLVPLLTGSAGADVLIPQTEPRPRFDVWLPLLSLPRIFGHDPTCFPAPIPCLRADAARVQKWKARLSPMEGLKIGIVWQGSKYSHRDRLRSFRLSALAPIAQVPGVSLISLQKGYGTEQLANLTEFHVHTLGEDFDNSGGAFLDTAGVMQSLDLVISADTAVAHVAGALGRPVWLALAFVPDWRWTMHGSTTSAYPTMRLFRQAKPGDWASVFQEMAEEIKSLLNALGS